MVGPLPLAKADLDRLGNLTSDPSGKGSFIIPVPVPFLTVQRFPLSRHSCALVCVVAWCAVTPMRKGSILNYGAGLTDTLIVFLKPVLGDPQTVCVFVPSLWTVWLELGRSKNTDLLRVSEDHVEKPCTVIWSTGSGTKYM